MREGFLSDLASLLRAEGPAAGAAAGGAVFAPYVLTAEKRRAIPIIADPDRQALARLEIFYNAVALAVERTTGVMVSPIVKMHPEGFGRVVLTAGRLVVYTRTLRDIHRFGFESVEALAASGEALVGEAVHMIDAFPEAARYEA